MPEAATATNKVNSGLQQTLIQPLTAPAVLAVHVIPSGLVITLSVPEAATATNKVNSGLQQTLIQPLTAPAVLAVHVIPSGLVITLSVLSYATATNRLNSGLQQTLPQPLTAPAVLAVQLIPPPSSVAAALSIVCSAEFNVIVQIAEVALVLKSETTSAVAAMAIRKVATWTESAAFQSFPGLSSNKLETGKAPFSDVALDPVLVCFSGYIIFMKL